MNPSSTSLEFVPTAPTGNNVKKAENIKNTLIEENGKLYMIIQDLEPKQYFAKIEITIIKE